MIDSKQTDTDVVAAFGATVDCSQLFNFTGNYKQVLLVIVGMTATPLKWK